MTQQKGRIAIAGRSFSTKSGPLNIYWKPADGSGTEERLTTSQYIHTPHSWSPDGKVLAFQEINPKTGRDIWLLAMEGDRKSRPLLATPFDEMGAVLSPDGRWLAYVSNESLKSKVAEPLTAHCPLSALANADINSSPI